MKKNYFIILILLILPILCKAQDDNIQNVTKKPSWFKTNNVADHLDVGISVSTMGLGLEVKTPVTHWVALRAGVDWMPRFTMPMSFNLNTYSDGMPTGNFAKVADMLYDMTGIEIDETVHMNGKGSLLNFKFMVDVYPFRNNRNWYFTAGFYVGNSMIARAVNAYEEKPTLVGINIYNRAYEYFTTLEDIYDVPVGGGATMNPEEVEKLQQRFSEYGRMGIHIGDFKDGSPYIMEPSPDGTISAKAYVNHFKPYVGLGFNTDLDSKKRWHLDVNVGAIFWGGAPNVINHDYSQNKNINFTKDLQNIRGKVGDYMKMVKALPVYPMVAIRVSYSIL